MKHDNSIAIIQTELATLSLDIEEMIECTSWANEADRYELFKIIEDKLAIRQDYEDAIRVLR